MTTIIIPACGESARWNGQNKLLADVNGEPLIKQSVRRFRERGIVIVMTHWPEVKKLFPYDCIEPKQHRWSAETLLASKPWWSQKGLTVWAHGDVLWGDDSFDRLFYPGNPSPFVIGHYSEALGFTFLPEQHTYMENALQSIITYFEDGGEARMGAIRATMPLYRAIRGVPFTRMPHPDPKTWPNFYNIRDNTVDLDTPETLAEWSRICRGEN